MPAGGADRGARRHAGGARAAAGKGKLAGCPKLHEAFEAADQAGEGGEDEDVQRRNHPVAGGLLVGLGADVGQKAGDVLGQGRLF